MKIFFYVVLVVGILFADDIRRDSNSNVVVDGDNNLIWQDNEEVIKNRVSQPEAIEYCSNLTLGGAKTWRVPSIAEYQTIVDKTDKTNNINSIFEFKHNKGYWANTVKWRTLWFYADYMHFVSGTPYYDNKKKKKFVRCVRYIVPPAVAK
jgi:hypothetical protein